MDLKLEFYVGIHDIAEFLGLHWKTCARYLREGKIVAARRDSLGRWVLSNLDYYRSLKDVRPVSSPEMKTYAGVKWGLQNPSVIIVGVHHPRSPGQPGAGARILPGRGPAAGDGGGGQGAGRPATRSGNFSATPANRGSSTGCARNVCGRWRSRTRNWPGST